MVKVLMVTTTATFAEKGKDVLQRNGISSRVKKIQGGTAAGCLFGIMVDVDDYQKAIELLKDANVRVISVKEVPS